MQPKWPPLICALVTIALSAALWWVVFYLVSLWLVIFSPS